MTVKMNEELCADPSGKKKNTWVLSVVLTLHWKR